MVYIPMYRIYVHKERRRERERHFWLYGGAIIIIIIIIESTSSGLQSGHIRGVRIILFITVC